ncbi:hypothetical protein A2V47_08015 [Candidatus Atribacteria bacterium RBG_19FT_COMBO_35_14]|uniref:Uncharacterized protein n=1 Tax=Candidatus Sediminicultor quintus TaxID=1797291 RepID=A0A1F5A9E8_9BACT|nr:MAG: hypothetical protein A2V47_08015 [Candidatus Atribacteria bacterium RBG_19FT_COMBO_35_14]
MFKKSYSILIFFIIVALIVAGIITFNRSRLESNFKQVELVMSLNELRELSYQEGHDEIELLAKIKYSGINSIAIHEDTLENLVFSGKILYFSNKELNNLNFFLKSIAPFEKYQSSPGEAYIIFKDKNDYLRIKENLQRHLGEDLVRDLGFLSYIGLKVKGSEEKLADLGLGFSEEDIELVRNLGFQVILRLKNFPQINKEDVEFKFKESDKAGKISGMIFEGESVLGYPSEENLIHTAELLKIKEYSFGIIEFAGQKGIETVAHQVSELAVRVHSITKEEMDIISKQKATERWIRAAKERKVRIFYIKPFMKSNSDLIEENLAYITTIKEELKNSGFKTGRASILSTSYQEPKIFILLLILGVISGGLILLKNLFNLKKYQEYSLLLLAILFSLLLLFLNREMFLIKLMALLTALIFPTLAIIYNERYFLENNNSKFKDAQDFSKNNPSFNEMIKKVLSGFFRIILITLSGALLITALLSNNKFMLGIEQFSGIKISYLLPLLLVLAIMWLKVNKGKLMILENIKKPILIEHVIIMVFFALFLVIYISRSGNFSFLPVLSIEEKIRIFLEKTLIARPRNKEFLIGYPALLLAISMNYLKIKEFKIPIIIIGTIGPVTLINTFCHIHTPFLFSMLRTFNGLWLGLVLGLIVVIIFYYLVKIFRKKINEEKV